MSICGDCEFYKSIDAEKGNCKQTKVERHVVIKEGNPREIINGWPVVDKDEASCGEFSQEN